jgi:DNA-binding response OmpR family regulator
MATESYNIAEVNFLIVEDSDHMRSLVRNILNALGAHFVREARDVSSAYEMLSAFPVDIVICDWQMEPVSGLDFVRQLRSKEGPHRFMPIIMLTAHSEAKRVTEARDAGVNEFVIKPIAAKTLYTRIREIIKNPRPFIETKDYFGPDRRRRETGYQGDDKRGKPAATNDAGAGAPAAPNA